MIDANWPAGTFASYHAYPYYPDFLRHEPALQDYPYAGRSDPYAGYVAALRRHHPDMPTLITEFGVPSSIGSAHNAPLGRTQGDHSEAADDRRPPPWTVAETAHDRRADRAPAIA